RRHHGDDRRFCAASGRLLRHEQRGGADWHHRCPGGRTVSAGKKDRFRSSSGPFVSGGQKTVSPERAKRRPETRFACDRDRRFSNSVAELGSPPKSSGRCFWKALLYAFRTAQFPMRTCRYHPNAQPYSGKGSEAVCINCEKLHV